MKKRACLKIIFLVILSCSLFTFSCKKKTFNDALPVVTIESVKMISLDSVELVGSISSKGADAIEYYGFAYSKESAFTILKNQVLFEGSTDGTFKAVVPAEHDSTYYFKAFGANGFGYKASDVIKYKVPRPAPIVVPCTLTNNYFNDNGFSFPVSVYGNSVTPSYGNYEVDIYSSSEDITMWFPYKPINGIYTTTSDRWNIGAGKVCINISHFYLYYVNDGGKVYVNVDSLGTTSISVCNVQYNYNSSNIFPLSGKASFN